MDTALLLQPDGSQVLLTVGFERDRIRGFDPALLDDRFLRLEREPVGNFLGQRQLHDGVAMCARLRERELNVGVVVIACHRLQDAGASSSATAAESASRCKLLPVAASSAVAICSHSASTSPPHSASGTSSDSLVRRNPGSRPREATRCLLPMMALSSCGVSGGLSQSRQCSRNTSSKRIVLATIPTGKNGSRSISRTSTYSTPRSRNACSGRSPGRITRLGRMVP